MEPSDLQQVLQILYLGVVPAAGVFAWIAGLVLHGVGRTTAGLRGFVVYALGVAMGGALATSLGALQVQPTPGTLVNAVALVGLPLAFIVGLAMFGNRRVAGLLLAGAATPWTAISAGYLLAIVMGHTYEPLFTVAMVLLGLVPLVTGLVVATAGDPKPNPDPAAPIGQPGSRRPGSMARTFTREATYFTIGPSFVLPMAAATLSSLAIPGQPLIQAAVTVAAAAIGTEIELRWIPPDVKRALEGFHWVGLDELRTFKAATGSPIPTTAGGFNKWLASHPETDATRRWRVEMLAFIGEVDRARTELARMVPATPLERLRRASLSTELDWIQGGPANVDMLGTLAMDTGPDGSPDRLAADGLIAWWHSRLRLAALDPDWRRPLAEFRARLGNAAAGLHASSMRRQAIVFPMLLGLGFVLIGQIGR